MTNNFVRATLLRVLALLPLVTAAQVPAPPVAVLSLADLPTPLPLPYDEAADARGDIDAAFARAQVSGRRVMIRYGGNWCPDCRILAGVMALPEVAPFVAAQFEVVTVDVGRFDRNLDQVTRFGLDELKGVPTVVIAEPDGTVLNRADSADLADARSYTPQGIVDWLARYGRPAGE